MLRHVGDGTDYESRMERALRETSPRFRAVLRAGYLRAGEVFSAAVLASAKSTVLVRELKEEDPYLDALARFAESQAGRKITRIQATTKKRIRSYIEEALVEASETGERSSTLVAAAIKEAYDGMSDGRAYTIARTETHNAALYAMQESARSLEIPGMKKGWVSAPNDGRNRDFHLEMNGEEVLLSEKFEVRNPNGGVDEMDGPGDTSAPAEQVVSCRCVLVFSTT